VVIGTEATRPIEPTRAWTIWVATTSLVAMSVAAASAIATNLARAACRVAAIEGASRVVT
jgi:hypothetical protein